MKNGKKIITLALTATMAFSVMSVSSFAASFDVSGIGDGKVDTGAISGVVGGIKDNAGNIGSNHNGNTNVTQPSAKMKAKAVILDYANHTGAELTEAFETVLEKGAGTTLAEQKAFKKDCETYMTDEIKTFDEDDIKAVIKKVDDYLDDVRHESTAGSLSDKISGVTGDDSSIKDSDGNVDTSKVKDFLNKKGYSDDQISDLLKKAGLDDDQIADIMGEEIKDEKTPLAGAVNFTDDHIAYIKGYADNTFRPYNGITRAEAACMLYRLLDDDTHAKFDTSTNRFSDINATNGSWYITEVNTLANAGVIDGFPNGTFRPNDQVTRAQLVKMVVAVMGLVEGSTEPYADVAPSDWYYTYVATAYTKGWTNGWATTNAFNANNPMKRFEVVTFVNNALGRCVDTNFINSHVVLTFKDVNETDAFYGAVMEAANGHDHTVTTQGAEEWVVLK